MHLMAGLLLFIMGLFTYMVPNVMKQEKVDFLNRAGLAYSFLGIAILLSCIFLNKKLSLPRFNLTLRAIEIIGLSTLTLYSLSQKWYLPTGYGSAALLGLALAYFWERRSNKKSAVSISENGIQAKPVFYKEWSKIQNVILKHNILTVDCTNNKLFQFTVINTLNDTERASLIEYCNEHIALGLRDREKDW